MVMYLTWGDGSLRTYHKHHQQQCFKPRCPTCTHLCPTQTSGSPVSVRTGIEFMHGCKGSYPSSLGIWCMLSYCGWDSQQQILIELSGRYTECSHLCEHELLHSQGLHKLLRGEVLSSHFTRRYLWIRKGKRLAQGHRTGIRKQAACLLRLCSQPLLFAASFYK